MKKETKDTNAQIAQEEKEKVIQMCICKGCPSFVDCGEEIGYCHPAVGKSKCISEEKGCICGSCPVTKKMGLQNDYFCTRGAEDQQCGD